MRSHPFCELDSLQGVLDTQSCLLVLVHVILCMLGCMPSNLLLVCDYVVNMVILIKALHLESTEFKYM